MASVKSAITYIIAAQIASDSGKYIDSVLRSVDGREARIARRDGYEAKNQFILKAIQEINRLKDKSYGVILCAYSNAYRRVSAL